MAKPDIAEIELDKALVDCPDTKISNCKSLGDSGNSSSSLLDRLEETMKKLKKSHENTEDLVVMKTKSNVKLNQVKPVDAKCTVKLDLRCNEKVRICHWYIFIFVI